MPRQSPLSLRRRIAHEGLVPPRWERYLTPLARGSYHDTDTGICSLDRAPCLQRGGCTMRTNVGKVDRIVRFLAGAGLILAAVLALNGTGRVAALVAGLLLLFTGGS